MPNAFLAHAYDLADVWVNCGDKPQTKACAGCDTADPDYNCLTPFYMGPGIHPRLKKPVGQRLAAAALASVYGWGGPVTGPTLAGCAVAPGGASLALRFNTTLLAGGALAVAPYAGGRKQSGLSVLTNSTDVFGSGSWVAVDIALGAGGDTVVADLSPLGGGAPQAVKYAWGATGGAPNDADVVCCATPQALCAPGECPIKVAAAGAPFGGMPGNPFLAQIVNGKCACPAPQLCDA